MVRDCGVRRARLRRRGGVIALRWRPRHLLLATFVPLGLYGLQLIALAVPATTVIIAAAALIGGVGVAMLNIYFYTAIQQQVPISAISRVSALKGPGHTCTPPTEWPTAPPAAPRSVNPRRLDDVGTSALHLLRREDHRRAADRRAAASTPALLEPYAGSLAVLLAKPRVQFETVNDLDQDLVLFWRVLRERGDELASVCALTPHSRAEHTAAFDLDVTDELERARRVWVRLSQGRGGMLRRTGWRFYRDAARRAGSMPWTLNAYVDRLWDATERLAGVSLEYRPALRLITDYGQHPNVLIYADPPYLGSTRGWGNQYQHEMCGGPEHRELAAALRSCAVAVVLSGYPSPL